MPERVLILDDDRLIVTALAHVLEEAGFATTCHVSPRAALAALAEQAPAVILSDYTMPEMDGVAFLAEARRVVPDAVRILCTSADDFEVAQGAVNAGQVSKIISKPWEARELVATVRQGAETARLRRENERLQREVQWQNERLLTVNAELELLNHDLEEMVQERTEALLEGLISALDYRDTATQWHSRRVARYARHLAGRLGIREPELSVLERGALLHDLGKIGVSDRVLHKEGPLGPEEWVDMKRHPELGWALLQRVDYLRAASPIVLQHQEAWDGTGYPGGLRGEEIVLGARIFHVVDTLDAVTSDRPYRKARPYADARAEILRCRGTQFDPRVVDVFLAVPEDDWAAIRREVEQVALIASPPARRPLVLP